METLTVLIYFRVLSNQKAYVNFVESKQTETPVPETSTLFGLLTLGTFAIADKLTKKIFTLIYSKVALPSKVAVPHHKTYSAAPQ